MSKQHPAFGAAKLAVAGMFLAGSAVAMAAVASADPEPVPVPGEEVVAEAAPGQAVVAPVDPATVDPALPPVGQAPVVPEVVNPTQSSGALGALGDLWDAARTGNVDELNPTANQTVGAPEGAGPAPMLPPGYVSLTAPESTNLAPVESDVAGPALPEGYYPIDGPPPPGYEEPVAPADPTVPATP